MSLLKTQGSEQQNKSGEKSGKEVFKSPIIDFIADICILVNNFRILEDSNLFYAEEILIHSCGSALKLCASP